MRGIVEGRKLLSLTEAPIRIAIDARPLGGAPCGFTIYLCSVIECLRRAGFDVNLRRIDARTIGVLWQAVGSI